MNTVNFYCEEAEDEAYSVRKRKVCRKKKNTVSLHTLNLQLLTHSWICNDRFEMPIPLFADVVFKGKDAVPFAVPILKALPCVVLTWVLKWYFGGASNTSERLMHSKVVMITVHYTKHCS